MDGKLMAWALAVKARQRHLPARARLPVLWLFTDARRLPDPLPAVARLPRRPGLCGVVLRHDGEPGRAALGERLRRLCRMGGVALVVAGDAVLAARLGAGLHLRGGRRAGRATARRLVTSSAHGVADLVRARRVGAALVFLSPFAPTASHPGQAPLGALRWCRLAAAARVPVAALGGINGRSAPALARTRAVAVGAIGGLS